MLSDSFPRQTFAKFSTYFNVFKYSLLFSIYPGVGAEESQFDSLQGYKALVTHRLEFNLFNNKVGLVINEACMYWSSKAKRNFSLWQINPFGFMHDEYVTGNGNSLLVFEANYTPINGVNVYGQFAVDEFSGPGEERTNPAAFGVLAGVKGALTIGQGILYGSFEFAKTDPFLYLRGLHYSETKTDYKGYGFDAALRIISCDRVIIQNKFVTYKYGNDVIIFDGKINYEIPNKFTVGFEAMFMKHGSMNVNSYWGRYTDNKVGDYENAPDVSTPTTFNPFEPEDYDASTGKTKQEHAIETSTILSLSAKYNILSCLSVYTYTDLLIVKNVNNVEGVDGTDLQVTLGISYTL